MLRSVAQAVSSLLWHHPALYTDASRRYFRPAPSDLVAPLSGHVGAAAERTAS